MTTMEFNTQLARLGDNLQKYAVSLTMNSEDAKDLVQETYFKAIANKDKFEADTNLKAWTYTIMRNTFINNYRKKVKNNTAYDNTENLHFLNRKQDSGYVAPEVRIQAEEIENRIANLDKDYGIPFSMHVKGYKYKEIADHLGLKIGTVKSRIFFSRKKLMQSLKDYA